MDGLGDRVKLLELIRERDLGCRRKSGMLGFDCRGGCLDQSVPLVFYWCIIVVVFVFILAQKVLECSLHTVVLVGVLVSNIEFRRKVGWR